MKTAKRYIDEFKKKYAVNMPLSDTPKNRALQINGDLLEGDYILELPVQRNPVPEEILQYAREKNVTLRDVAGHVYN